MQKEISRMQTHMQDFYLKRYLPFSLFDDVVKEARENYMEVVAVNMISVPTMTDADRQAASETANDANFLFLVKHAKDIDQASRKLDKMTFALLHVMSDGS